jgi:excisionase family DNA binding protein
MNKSKKSVKTGITAIPFLNQGTHICHFYKDREELNNAIIPYIKAGLLANEKCIWITADPLDIEQAMAELKKRLAGIDDYISTGQLLIAHYDSWYITHGRIDIDSLLKRWIEAESIALDEGYDGLRAAGIMSWVQRENRNDLVRYEEAVESIIRKRQILALCSYPIDNLEKNEIIDMVSNHNMVVINREGGMMAIGNSRQAKISVMKARDLIYVDIGGQMGISKQRVHQLHNERRKSKKQLKSMLSSSEAASMLNIHVNTIRRWSDLGIVPVYRIGSRNDRRFKQKDIENLVLAEVSNMTQIEKTEYVL